jgi:hypothetical protein
MGKRHTAVIETIVQWVEEHTEEWRQREAGTGAMSLYVCFLLARVRATPFLSHPPPKRMSREMPALGHGYRSNDDPQRCGQYEVPDQARHQCYPQRLQDQHAGRENRVHEHRHEHALTGTLVDPHHEHPVGRQ